MDGTHHHRRSQPRRSSSSSSSFATSTSYRRTSSVPSEITGNSSFSPSTRPVNAARFSGISDSISERKPGFKQKPDILVEEKKSTCVSCIVGTCPFMCPEGERLQRERLGDLSVFERLNGNPRKTSEDLAIKKFCRNISAKHIQLSDVRPLPVLEKTISYLLGFLDSEEHPFEVIHEFIFDRTRSIRQDLSMQNIVNDKAIYMYEEMVKFYVISIHRIRRCSGSNISSMHHLNMEQLTKALTSLYNLYEVTRDLNSVSGNEAEFHSFYVLLHLDFSCQPMGESLNLWFRHLPSSIMKSKEMCFARKVLRLYRMGNYKQFFCIIASEASYLQSCIVESYINEFRVLAMSCINGVGYKLHPYPLTQLSKLLMMHESDVESFCGACGLETCNDDAGNKFLPMKQTTFHHPKEEFLKSYSFPGL